MMNKLPLLSLLGALTIVNPQLSSAQTSTKGGVELAMNMTSPDSLKKLFSDTPSLVPEKIEQAKKSLDEAYIRLEKNPHFSKTGVNKEVLFALMIKESMLDNSMISSSGATGYFQLKPGAITDVEEFIFSKLGIRGKKYDVGNPTDNCILGIVYYTLIHKKVSTLSERFDIDEAYSQLLTVAAYNLGAGDLGRIITIYDVEVSIESFDWDNFVIWVLKKAGIENPTVQNKYDQVYKISYRDWFNGQDYSKNDELIKFSSTLSLKKSKIQEFINYVEKIDAIAKKKEPVVPIQVEAKPVEKDIVQTKRIDGDVLYIKTTQKEGSISFLKKYGFSGPLALGVFYDINAQIFEGTGLLPQQTLDELPQSGEYKLPVIAYKAQIGDSLSTILEKKGIPQRYLKKVIDFNKNYGIELSEKNSLQNGGYVFIPIWKTGFYSDGLTDETLLEAKRREKEEKVQMQEDASKTGVGKQVDKLIAGKFDFYEWLKTIEVKTNKLEGKIFVLDPGHGGPDVGAAPIAKDKDGLPIPDDKSAILVKDDQRGKFVRVKPGKGSNQLLVYESVVTLDVTYRMAKLIRENGGEVIITRYNQTTGIINTPNSTTPAEDADVFSDTGSSWSYTRGNQNFRLKRGVEIANNTFKNKGDGKEVFFISVHADDDPRGPIDNPITFRYYHGTNGLSLAGRHFAELLAANISFRGKVAEAKGQGLYIVNPRFNLIPQSILIELANMRNAGSAYLLRMPDGRQRFADAIFEGIMKASGKK